MKAIRSATLLSLGLVAGCASVDPEPQYATHPTAYSRATYVIDARWLPPLRSEQVVFTRDDRRTIARARGFTGAIRAEMVRDAADLAIARVDRDISWFVNNKRRTYQECPLIGCSRADFLKKWFNRERDAEAEAAAPPPEESACVLKPVENSFKVRATGRKGQISDYPAEEYIAVWKWVVQDQNKRKNVSTMTFTLWTTPPTPELERVQQMNENFQRGLLERHKEHDTVIGQLLPADLYLQLTAFDGDISKNSIGAKNQFTQK